MRFARGAALVVVLTTVVVSAAESEKITGANYPLANKFSSDFVKTLVREANVSPQWIGKTDQFWYGTRTPEGIKYWRIDPVAKTKTLLFDPTKLATAVAEMTQKPTDLATLDINRTSVNDDGTKMKFVVGTTQYELEFATYKLTKLGTVSATPPGGFGKGGFGKGGFGKGGLRDDREERKDEEKKDEEKKDDDKKDDEKKDDSKKDDSKKDDGKTEPKRGPRGGGYKASSPDGKKYVYAFKHNLYLADEGKEADAVQLTTDGEENYSFSVTFGGGGSGTRNTDTTKMPPAEQKTRPLVTWSSDSKSFYTQRSDLRGIKDLFLINSLAEPRPTLMSYRYAMPGEENVRKPELFVCDAAAKKLHKVKLRWLDDRYGEVNYGKTGDEVRFIRRDRAQRHLELVSFDVKSATEKVLFKEAFEDAFLDYQPIRNLPDTDEFIWWSERSGWGHFYLYGRDGTLKNPITSGAWRASVIVEVDAKNRLLYFRGNAREAGENIYYQHLYRVRFDGSDLTCLDPSAPTATPQPVGLRGWNQTSFMSPSRRFVVVNSSRVDEAPVAALYDDKGHLGMHLESTDTSRLLASGWKAPEVFMAKAADGVTDLYGNMWKPFDFDPKKKYPIINYVYPGPQMEGLNQTFSAHSTYMQLAQLGFIVIQSGHRGGAPTRSKAYHSYGYYNLRDYGLADKKAVIEQLAARHSFIDIDRVGIYGHSGGAFMSAAALLQKPYNEFFKAAVASAGNHDNNIYNDNWSERYHGLKEVAVTETKEKEKEKEKSKGSIPPSKPIGFDDPAEEEADAQDKKDTTKKDDVKKDDTKKDVKKDDVKKDDVKKDDTKKDIKKDDVKKDEKKDDTKKEVKKDDIKKDETKKEETKKEAPKTKYEIRVPTNTELAANLKGHILLVHGDMDNNVHPANTIRLVDALIKANKRFDMLIMPGKPHAFGDYQPYFIQRTWEFFALHLLDDKQTSADIYDKKNTRK